jgi:hypothetical protein
LYKFESNNKGQDILFYPVMHGQSPLTGNGLSTSTIGTEKLSGPPLASKPSKLSTPSTMTPLFSSSVKSPLPNSAETTHFF